MLKTEGTSFLRKILVQPIFFEKKGPKMTQKMRFFTLFGILSLLPAKDNLK